MLNHSAFTKTVINYDKPIQFGTGWNCCIGREAYVIVFDDGTRWAVCSRCANAFTGTVHSLFMFSIWDANGAMFSFKYLDTMLPVFTTSRIEN